MLVGRGGWIFVGAREEVCNTELDEGPADSPYREFWVESPHGRHNAPTNHVSTKI